MSVEQLDTERLVLEPLTEQHAAALFPNLRDPKLYEFLDEKPPESVAFLQERFRRWSSGRSPDGSEVWLNWAARLRGTEEFVGWFQATVQPVGEAQIAYLVFVEHQRHGFAREASAAVIGHIVAAHQVTCVSVSVDPRNEASIRLAKALGLDQTESATSDLRFVRVVRDGRP